MDNLYLCRRGPEFLGGSAGSIDTGLAVFGVPFDSSSSYFPGSRFGPQALREAVENIEFYSFRHNVDLERYRIPDLGDVAVVHGDASETIRRVRQVSLDILRTGYKPVMIGGEHTVSLGVLEAMLEEGIEPRIVIFDAHFDLRDEYLGNRYSHASVMRRIGERVGLDNLLYLGVRAASGEEVDLVRREGVEFYTPQRIRMLGIREVARRIQRFAAGRPLYVSIDLDVYDPAYAPGVGNPEADGLEPWLVLDLVSVVFRLDIAGFDIVELNPLNDCGRSTAVLAAKTLIEAAAAIVSANPAGPRQPLSS